MLGVVGKLVYYLTRGIVWLIAKLYFRIRIEGMGNVPKTGAVLVASNHVSHLDPPLIGISMPRMVFHMAKRELAKVGLLQWYMKSIGTILVDRGRGREAVETAIDYLDNGRCVVIFPEGTRSTNGRLMKGKSGAVVLAIRSGCQILPTVMIGSEKAMTKGSKAIKPVKVVVRFGKPYRIDYDGDPHNIPKDVLVRERYLLMERIQELLPDYMHPNADDKDKWYPESLGTPTKPPLTTA